MANAYKLSTAGTLTTYQIPANGATIPALHGRPDADRRILPGQEDPHWASETLPACIELARTIAPGVEFWFAPGLESLRGRDGAVHFGVGADQAAPYPVCVVRSNLSFSGAANLTIHEAAHSAQTLLTADELATMNAAIARGPKITCAYEGKPDERYERLVADAGMILLMTGRYLSHPSAPETVVIARILSGEVGRRRLHQTAHAPSKAPKPSFSARLAKALCLNATVRWLGCPVEG